MKKICLIVASMLISFPSYGAEFDIEMLNKHGKQRNAYSEPLIYIDVGDTINWLAKSRGHNVEFISKNGVPDGVGKFKSRLSKKTQFKFEVPGIYAYWCTPHRSMGMIGFVVVGDNKSNLPKIKKIRFKGKSKKLAAELIKKIEGN